jgi:hypothetical protein
MARTPLMHSLQRLAADYRLARAHGLPLHAIHELRAEARQRAQNGPERSGTAFTRRQMLLGAGATLAGLALPLADARCQWAKHCHCWWRYRRTHVCPPSGRSRPCLHRL